MTPFDLRAVAAGALLLGGLGALSALGPVAAVAAATTAAALAATRWIRGARPPPAVTGAGIAAGGVALGAAGWTGDRAEALGVLLALLAFQRVVARPLLADRVPVVVSTLSLLVAVARRDDPLLLVPVGLHAALLPVALLVARPERAAAAGLSLASLALSGAAFVLAPRLAAEPEVGATGFADGVELGVMDALLDDPTPVFRARIEPAAEEPPYWRGRALDRFDGRAWTAPEPRTPVEVAGPRRLPPDARVVEVEPERAGDVVFTAGRVVDVRTDGAPLTTDGRGGFRAEGVGRWRLVALPPLSVDARPAWDDAAGDLATALELPADLDPRVLALAATVAGEGSPAQQLDRIRAHLRSAYAYTRTPRDAGDVAPLATFLFETRAGHCEYFATALAVLGRARGIPTRVVNGYVGGAPGPDGWLQVRERDAHAWVEAWIDGQWRAVDATPGPAASARFVPSPGARPPLGRWLGRAYQDQILGYDRDDQVRAMLAASRWAEGGRAGAIPWRGLLGLAVAGVALGAVAGILARRAAPLLLDPPPPPPDPVREAWRDARAALAAQGLEPPASLPPVAAAEWIAAARPGDAADALIALAWLRYEIELTGRDPHSVASRAQALADRAAGRVRDRS
jgi:transglutaminase-like putative cysteine protease